MAFHTILVPYHFASRGEGSGAGPEALAASGSLNGLEVSGLTTIDVEPQGSDEVRRCLSIDAAVAAAAIRVRDSGETPIVISGDCHACLGSLAAAARPTAILWFDAHGDLNTPATTETGYFDGMALATALGWCWRHLTREMPQFATVDERDVVLVGGRDLDRGEQELLVQSRVRHYITPALRSNTDASFNSTIEPRRGTTRAYVHLDLDVLDPSELPVSRFKAPGGVSVAWLEAALRDVRSQYEIAAVGVSAYDPSYASPQAAGAAVNRLLRALLM